MRAVNLLPKDAARAGRKAPNPVLLTSVAGFCVVTVFLAAGFMRASGAVAEKQGQLEGLELQLQVMPKPEATAGPSAAEQQLTVQRDQRATALNSALATRVAWDRILRELSLVLPSDVWITSLVGSSPAPGAIPAPGAEPTGLTILGNTYSHDGVARLLSRLQVLPALTNIRLKQSNRQGGVDGPVTVTFTIAADVRPPGATS